MDQKQQFCTFFVDGFLYGIEVEMVQEVLGYQEITPVPLAPPAVSGLINLRGQIVAAIDLRRRLDRRKRPDDRQPSSVVIRAQEGAVSLLVDEIGDVVEVDKESFEQAPEVLDSKARELIRGVHKLEGRLMLALDCEQVLNLGS